MPTASVATSSAVSRETAFLIRTMLENLKWRQTSRQELKWPEDEVVIVMAGYAILRLIEKASRSAEDPIISGIGRFLGRTNTSIYMQFANFAHYDPAEIAVGNTHLSNNWKETKRSKRSKRNRIVMETYSQDPNKFLLETVPEAIRSFLVAWPNTTPTLLARNVVKDGMRTKHYRSVIDNISVSWYAGDEQKIIDEFEAHSLPTVDQKLALKNIVLLSRSC